MKNPIKYLPVLAAFVGFGTTMTSCNSDAETKEVNNDIPYRTPEQSQRRLDSLAEVSFADFNQVRYELDSVHDIVRAKDREYERKNVKFLEKMSDKEFTEYLKDNEKFLEHRMKDYLMHKNKTYLTKKYPDLNFDMGGNFVLNVEATNGQEKVTLHSKQTFLP